MGLEGISVLVTRALEQTGELRRLLESEGASVHVIPTIAIAEPKSWDEVDAAIGRLSQYQWIVFASANAVDRLIGRRPDALKDFKGRLAAVGSQTARRLEERRVRADLVPAEFSAEGLLRAFPHDLQGVRILLPRGEAGNDVLPQGLASRGARLDVVTVYRNEIPESGGSELRALLDTGGIDCITLTSGSSLRNLIRMLDVPHPLKLLTGPAIAVIGPSTRDTARRMGLHVDIEPATSTIPALVNAIRRYFEKQ
jgi:uroporphyrinogen III methyltransferase/synthase